MSSYFSTLEENDKSSVKYHAKVRIFFSGGKNKCITKPHFSEALHFCLPVGLFFVSGIFQTTFFIHLPSVAETLWSKPLFLCCFFCAGNLPELTGLL